MSDKQMQIRLAVFDWAGTTVDFGCFAPVAAFMASFAQHGVTVTAEEARGPMGLHKKDHIREMLRSPSIATRWQTAHEREWTEADVESLFQAFMPMQMEVLHQHTDLIPGLPETVEALKRRHIGIAGTTGYFRAAAERIQAIAAQQGYIPDIYNCPEDVSAGRPAPWMIYRSMEKWNVFPPRCVIKVGDTIPDIEEGRNAGVWTIAITDSSSEIGCTLAEWNALGDATKEQKRSTLEKRWLQAGAHAVIPTIAHVPQIIDQIEDRLRQGEVPY